MTVRWKPYIIALLAAGYVILGISAVKTASNSVTQRYFEMLGTKALDIARMAVASYQITDEEVAQLKKLNFRQILNHPANIRLNDLFSNGKFSEDFKYAYIYVHLAPGEEKYTVPKDCEDYYDAPEGAALDMLYLVDAIINENEQIEVSHIEDYYDDINRYTTMRSDLKEAYASKEATYLITQDEYGNAFTGTLPVYSVEGTYIGNFGVDIYYEDFISMVNKMDFVLTILFVLPSVLLSIFFVSFYRKRMQEADKDPLTGLYNRRFMDKKLKKYIKKSMHSQSPMSVIMLDIDWFKKYNDRYGHQQGDIALKAFGKTAIDYARRKDIPCRFGGEECLIILPETDEQTAIERAKKIQYETTQLKIEHKGNPDNPYLTISIGIYTAIPKEDGELAIKKFIECADQALYQAKTAGRNQYQVYHERKE